jgi:glycosyltransferase involved in cell wall biosynthesis
VPVGDVISLANNLGLLLDDVEAARILGVRARKRVEQAFSLQTVGAQLHEFLRDRGAFKTFAAR